MTENIFEETIRKERARLSKAARKVQRAGDAILAGVLDTMNREHPGWTLTPTEADDVIMFTNKADTILLNLTTGELVLDSVLSETGKSGLKVLLKQVKCKKRKWLRVRARFEKALTRARSISMLITQQLDEIKKSISPT